MEFQIETNENVTVVHLSGAFDRPARSAIAMELLSLPRYGIDLIIDLSQVNYISSAGLHLLLDLYRHCQQLNAHLFLTAPSNAVREILDMTGFASSGLPVYDTLEEGLSVLQANLYKGNVRGDFVYEEGPPAQESPSLGESERDSEGEEVHFSAFYPREVTVEKWYSLFVYAYIPTLLESVREDARRFREEIGKMHETKPTTGTRLARETEITIVPACRGVKFNPPAVKFQWLEDVHRAQFRLQAGAELASLAGNLRVTVYAGPLIVGALTMGMLFNETESGPGPARSEEVHAGMYHQDDIFISYSHQDTDIVRLCKKAYESLGHNVLVDFETLRSGQDWNAELKRLIERADVFQLFWSENSSKSEYCRQEWLYALGLKRSEGFIRPVYWQEPLPPPPDELNAIHFDFAPFTVHD